MDFNPDTLLELLSSDLGIQIDPIRSFKSEALKKALIKKYTEGGKRQAELQLLAFDNFKAINSRCEAYVVDDVFRASDIFRQWRLELHKAFYSGEYQSSVLTLRACVEEGACGPGASIGADDCTFFTKMFDSALTATSDSLYKHYVVNLSPRWRAAENIRREHHTTKVVPGSKLSSVPKDRTKRRTTCKEPVLNMFFQLGAKQVLERILGRTQGISLETMPVLNKRLARIGSVSGEFATIDLKDASDSISVALCEALLPRPVFDVLMKIRSHHCHIGSDLVKLHMMSTMGNGFTFALMTLLFATLIRSIYWVTSRERVQFGRDAGAFGDDLIVKTEYASLLIDTLSSAGLVVNVEKSFVDGPFRESCGGDYYLGHDVRGVYIKRMTNEAHCYSAFNRLHFWAIRHGFCLDRTLRYLKALVQYRPVPYDAGFHAGFIVTRQELIQPRYVRERNSHDKKSVQAGLPIKLRSLTEDAVCSTPALISNMAIEYHALEPVREYKGRCGERFANYHGGLISFLGGYVRDDQMSIRPKDEPRYRVVRRSTPSWDWITYPQVEPVDLSRSWTCILMQE